MIIPAIIFAHPFLNVDFFSQHTHILSTFSFSKWKLYGECYGFYNNVQSKYEKVSFLFLFLNHAMIYDSEFCFKLSSAVYLFHDNEYCTLAMKLNASSLHKIKELYLLTIQIGNSLEQQTMLKPHYATHTSLFHWLVRECFSFSFKKRLLQMFPILRS